jgi:hypothetical protein
MFPTNPRSSCDRNVTVSRMPELVRRLPWAPDDIDEPDLLQLEWLVTNGLGGYASGTVAGPVTRRHHGLLVAALPAPLGSVYGCPTVPS